MRERVREMIAAALVTSVGCGLAATADVTDLTDRNLAAQEQPALDAGTTPASDDAGDGDDPASDGGAATTAAFPCDVAAILQDNCLLCHGDPPFRAPMPLAQPSNFQGESWGDPERTMIDVVTERVVSDEPGRKMPPPALGDMTPEQVKTLTDWLAAGAKPAPAGTVCPPRNVGVDDGAAADDDSATDPSASSDTSSTDAASSDSQGG